MFNTDKIMLSQSTRKNAENLQIELEDIAEVDEKKEQTMLLPIPGEPEEEEKEEPTTRM